MAYEPKTLRILPGGLNLLPPSDQVAEGDCIDLTDWWPASLGRLEQAPVLKTLSSGSDFGKDSLAQSNGNIFYGGNGFLSEIGRGRIDSGYDGYPLGLISFQGWLWIMNPTRQRRYQDTGATFLGVDWFIGAADQGLTVVDLPGQGGLLVQEYEYYLTWFIQGLGETNPSPVAPYTTALGDAVSLTRPDISDAPFGATGWNVYRQDYIDSTGVGVFGIAYLVNPSPIPIAQTTYIDFGLVATNQDPLSLKLLGVIMADDHDPPPPARIVANQVYNGRIVVANSSDHPNRIWYTDSLEPAFFPGANNANSGNWVDVGTDSGDAILAIAVRPLTLIVYRQRSIWRVLGDFDDPNSRIDPIVPELGIAGPRAMVSTSLGDYFAASAGRGIYSFNNDWAQKISDKVDPIWRSLPTENFQPLGKGHESQIALGYRDGRLWCSYPLSDGFPAPALKYHIESKRWFAGSEGYGAFLDAGSEFIGVNGDVHALESVYEAGATAIAFQSQYHDCNLPDNEKTWADLVISHNTQGAVLTVTIRLDKDANPTNDSFVLTTIASNGLTQQIIPLLYPSNYAIAELQGESIRSFSLSIRISGFGAQDAPIVIDGPMLVHYHVEARKAKRFDTFPMDLGTQQVKVIDQVQFDVDATDTANPSLAAAKLQFYSDVPGGTMVLRNASQCQVGPTTGRSSEVVIPAQPVVGRLVRAVITTPTDFKIYGMRARVLAIGVYLDGTIHDFWEPVTISIGV